MLMKSCFCHTFDTIGLTWGRVWCFKHKVRRHWPDVVRFGPGLTLLAILKGDSALYQDTSTRAFSPTSAISSLLVSMRLSRIKRSSRMVLYRSMHRLLHICLLVFPGEVFAHFLGDVSPCQATAPLDRALAGSLSRRTWYHQYLVPSCALRLSQFFLVTGCANLWCFQTDSSGHILRS